MNKEGRGRAGGVCILPARSLYVYNCFTTLKVADSFYDFAYFFVVRY